MAQTLNGDSSQEEKLVDAEEEKKEMESRDNDGAILDKNITDIAMFNVSVKTSQTNQNLVEREDNGEGTDDEQISTDNQQ